MLDMLSGALASAKTASEMGKTILELRDGEKIRAAVFDLRSQLMDLQERMLRASEEQMLLLGRVAELEQALADKGERALKRARYDRYQFEATGFMAYRLKAEYRTEELDHYLCSNCLEKDDSYMTLHGKDQVLTCPACKTSIRATPAAKRQVRRSSYSIRDY
ncbi:hypothetical protein [Stutzerimonas stutzeri]|uniref:hypothetical protein n=1 Tax=Stutzerimonas stutzeri TaxID=316 RepID=UPI00210E7705|nr:hypothetical protein [Stutzerimonas stutzeri]MCQ4242404.1 hypothetical protein [Stutzerimonas stutzeri]